MSDETLPRYDLRLILAKLERSQEYRMAGDLEPAIAQLTFAVAALVDHLRDKERRAARPHQEEEG